MQIVLADNQDITRAGLMYLCDSLGAAWKQATDKTELIERLRQAGDAVVVLDYTLFDINDIEELEILHERFPQVHWILFSVDLSTEFVRRAIAVSTRFSVLMKESPLQEIRECIQYAMRRQRYICQRMTEILLTPVVSHSSEDVKLTPTELEILKDIALGMTTREIAEKRFSSFHTVNTHRKNIFRKIGVNTVHEATRYALRAGLVDAAEYYI
ncbi:response regulator transcription factor [Prevotella sp. lc2012]|uniref:LuxR C-terminal-related transcriptional regulator n=1 Tax=Prevotella sp. lc2012 TaxID=1761886 RepID=UPI0008990844|nr:response regulator transcription factor [Prevotella sp. lc2012]SEE43927.1 DNA-binding response regulator, NarL/FixJ family, contains REC and HTH domains [Prevotella sp. lc2012]